MQRENPKQVVSEQGIEFIKSFEKFMPMPYDDGYGFMTVGYGHLIQKGEDFSRGLTKEEASSLFRKDLDRYERCVRVNTPVQLSAHQFDALVSFCFNVGTGAYKASTLRRKVIKGEHSEVPRQLNKWIRSAGRVSRGLIRRRKAEGAIYTLGLYSV